MADVSGTTMDDGCAIASVRARWPRCRELVEAAVNAIHAELMTDGLDDDAAYALAHVVLLHEIFFYRTVVSAREQVLAGRDDEDDGVFDWIANEYDDWAYDEM